MAMILESTANGMDEWFRRYREKYQADAAQPDWAVDVYAKMADMCRELNAPVASPPAPPPVPDTEHVPDTDRMWDMLVLAARASRYGG